MTGDVTATAMLSGARLTVSGNANITGSLLVQNNTTTRGVMTGRTLRVTTNADIHGNLAASGAVRTDSNITINDERTSEDAVLTFGNNVSDGTITYSRVFREFDINKGIRVTGTISGSGGVLLEHGTTLTGSIIRGFGLNTDCDGDAQTVSWDATSGQFGCGDDDQGGGSAGLVDHYVRASGDTMTGTLIVQNGTTHTPTGTPLVNVLGTVSGAQIRVSGPGEIHGALSASGSVRTDGNLTINDDLTAADATLTFGNSVTSGVLTYGNTFREFAFNSGIRVSGNISGSGNLLLEAGGTVSGSIIRGFGLNANCSGGTTDKLLWDSTTGRFSCGADEGGGGGGISYSAAEGMFVNQGGDTMTGTLVVNVSSNVDIVRSTSGSTAVTDFGQAGSSMLNVISENDALTISEGAIPNSGQGTVSTSTITTSGNVGAGSFVIFREDGQYIIAHGNGLATGSRWIGQDGSSMAASPTNIVSTGNVGAGGMALRRPDGRYLVIHGNSATNSSLFDPVGTTAVAAGPTLTSCTAGAGTNAVLTASGNYIIMCGGSGNWGVYNPTNNTYRAGTALGASFGAGSHALQRDDGTFLVFAGGNSSSHWILNPTQPTNMMWSSINPITSSPPTVTTGGFSIRRADGRFLVIPGAINSSYIYDPVRTSTSSGGTMVQQSGAGFGPTAALGDGAQAVWRQNGTYWLLIGGGSTATNIIDPSTNTSSQFTAGPTLNGGPNAGALSFMRQDGAYQVIRGAAGNVTEKYDMGFVLGGPSSSTGSVFTTECITAPATNTGSRLFWNTNSEEKVSFKVRTGNGSCSGSYRDVPFNGDLLRPAPGDNRVQVQVIFKRNIPRFADQEWGMRKGSSQTRYRRTNRDPTLFDFTIENSSGVHRTQFEFGDTGKASAPVAVNVLNEKDRKNELALAKGVAWPSTRNATNNYLYNGSFASNSALTTAASAGTVVMKRPDGMFVFISGNKTTANAQLFDPTSRTFSALGVTPTAAVSSGALAFKRPDGKFLLVIGGLTPLATNIYDPIANTFTAGPNLTGQIGAGPGSHVIPLNNGRVLIVHGNFSRDTSIYDTRQNTMMAGPQPTLRVGHGGMAIPRPDGSWLEIPGTQTAVCGLSTISNFFDPDEMAFTGVGSPTITTGLGPGATAFERSDGQWVITRGGGTAATCAATTATLIYNPITNRVLAGPTLTTAVRYGSVVMPRPDGSWLITVGNATTTTQIYFEKAGAYTAEGLAGVGATVAGPALVTAAGTGSVAFQTDDGKFLITSGANAVGSAGTTVAQTYDSGWVTSGYYASEIMQVGDLDSNSTLSWKAIPDMKGVSAEVRTASTELGIQTARAREVAVSGGRINPGAGETYVRAQFNFKRTFPSYGGIFTDVWYNSSNAMIVPWRQIPTPILQEFSINKDKDIISLRDANVPLFRVSTNGDIFTGNLGSVNTGGADLAERYTSPDDLKGGEVVAIDYSSEHGVRRTASSYQDDVLGVVSTAPGFVAGAFTKGSYPIALVGRVPVNVTNEGGPIKIGDRITSASLAGFGMKATEAGRVVGIAMDNLDLDRMQPCAQDKKRKCGQVMMFVNLSDYNGPKK